MTALLEPGMEIDGFRVAERVHAGGMSVIYRVTGRDAGFPLLMKVPRLGYGEPAESVISYEVEQLVLAALKGPHVPRFVAAGDLAVRPYLVMEHVEGRSLAEWSDAAPADPAEVARLGAALATALHSLHVQGAVHLDVKPANVIIRPTGEAVLIDFGLARHAHYPDLLAEEIRSPIGSAPYMSPEQVLGARWDPRSDLFALGAVLYELATGRFPWGSPSSLAALRKRLWRDPVPPRAIVRAVPGSRWGRGGGSSAAIAAGRCSAASCVRRGSSRPSPPPRPGGSPGRRSSSSPSRPGTRTTRSSTRCARRSCGSARVAASSGSPASR